MPDQKEKDRRRLLGGFLFLPLLRLRPFIGSAEDGIEESFDAMYEAYESSGSVAGALTKGHAGLIDAFTTLIGAALQRGYRDGARLSGIDDVPDFDKLAAKQAAKVARQMHSTTKGWVKKGGSDGFVFSSDRAERAAKYTGAEAYFNGMALAFKDSEDEFEKCWVTTSDDPCDDCLDNEDEEWIPMEEDFPSGHYAPLLHPNCQCYLKVRRVRE